MTVPENYVISFPYCHLSQQVANLTTFLDVLKSIVTGLPWMTYTHTLESISVTAVKCTFLKQDWFTVSHSSEMCVLILWDEVIFYYSYVALEKNIYSNHPQGLDFCLLMSTDFKHDLTFFPTVKTTVLLLQISDFKSF